MASKTHSLETDWARAPPPSGPVWQRIANALYNPEEKSFLGRTPKRWGIMLTFYTVFYAVLALLFAACMGGLFLTIDDTTPTWTLEKSLIGNNPGVASRPRPVDGVTVSYNQTGYEHYVTELNEFFNHKSLDDFITETNVKLLSRVRSNLYGDVNRSDDNGPKPSRSSEECSASDSYGYPATPCFFIKLNKIINWKPECYDDVVNLPSDMPEDLKDYIKALDISKLKQIWLSCWEEKSNLTKIEYPWGRGLSADHYPYVNAAGYVSPLLAIKVTPAANSLVAIRCRFWAKNVIYNKSLKEPSGYTRIILSIGDFAAESTTDASN